MILYIVVQRYAGALGVYDSEQKAQEYIESISSYEDIHSKYPTYLIEKYELNSSIELG